ncbi:MAG: hypothetical protein K8R88_15625 [Armatimonadetes bacterium]|nr:hypothetical protein [Armatimonadota bacterium]
MKRTFLHDNWQFRQAEQPGLPHAYGKAPSWLPAQVPGYVHLDLIANDIIADPLTEMHEVGAQWVDLEDWTYRTNFAWSPDSTCPRQVLKFNGLDTVCHIFLNNSLLATSENMFIPLETDVTTLLQPQNELEIRFQSPVKVGEQRREEYFAIEGLISETPNFEDRAFLRKAQYMFGWDWGPRLASCGIWRSVELQEFEGRILSFTLHQERLENGSFRVWSDTAVEGSGRLTTQFGNLPEVAGDFDLVIDNPTLWLPNGMGEQCLFEATAKLSTGDAMTKQIGLRTVSFDHERFELRVNDTKVWCRGANWIPVHSFPNSDNILLATHIESCKALNFNMLRVWGGGLYESEGFYDLCDLHGILVWQDFPFACSYYPDDQKAQAELEFEATHQLQRLRDRTSLAMLCGNNENEMMWNGKWGGRDISPPRYYGESLFTETLPRVINSLGIQTPYITTSPIDGGDEHYWEVWHGKGDWVHYADSKAKFCSEFGFSSASTSLTAENLKCPQYHWHDKSGKPFELWKSFVELHYPEAGSLEEWVYFSQLNQRDALQFGIEHFRRLDQCSGSLIWQWNNCWDAHSWAVYDFPHHLKPAAHELKRVYSDVVVCVEHTGSEVTLHLANASPVTQTIPIKIDLFLLSGSSVLAEPKTVSANVGIPAESSIPFETLCLPKNSVLRVRIQNDPTLDRIIFSDEPKNMVWPKPTYTAEVFGDDIHLNIQGIAPDLQACDQQPTRTVINETLVWQCPQPAVSSIIVRTLCGDSPVPLG